MKVKDVIGQIEHTYGRKSHKYLMSLMNDGLDEIAQVGKMNTKNSKTSLVKDQRWYTLLNSEMIDIWRVEVLDNDLAWRQIPRLTSIPEIGDED